MFDSFQICPYTGLRSFTEEESLYFKGREEDIDQATLQLQKNKFLMLTGASGDGKSSLIYAGIIPNARSGFLKSKYSRWCIADFRPERDPFGNLCRSIARELEIPNVQTVQSELSHGFSALVDLYRNSKRYLDTGSAAWQNSSEANKPALRREAANLIILVDQFEEFFTNPENYRQGVPTRDSSLVLNLLLEAARISLDEALPIYIVFTMRSDYIGQCAAFRGLAEYIGFSQFFVSRLNRSQLQLVIEEPATLSGNRINRRLTERLIHDITEGVDQLPILQHALNQIWVAAGNGQEEMDLIHYAMVGGMPAAELPDAQVDRFNNWFGALPAHIRACYHVPNLQNVLDTHTNKLYEEAAGYYQSRTGKTIAEADAKEIIRTAFTCLTKIDKSRAVRNRMTLQDITNILGRPDIDSKTINEILNIFREPGNTFLQPFIDAEVPGTRNLATRQVLDITHESLIRNWVYLGLWAKEEFDSRSVSVDFGQQLDRWVSSEKSRDFLLSIGPLTYFENWKNNKNPNEWWIARYLPDETDNTARLVRARSILNNANEFISRSARRHRVTRAVVRLGPRRIFAAAGLLALIVFSSFAARNYFRRQNAQVLADMHRGSEIFANKPDGNLAPAVMLMSEQLKSGLTTVPEIVAAVKDPVQRANIATGIATILVMQGRGEPVKEIRQSLVASDSTLENLPVPLGNVVRIGKSLKEINDELTTLLLAHTYRPDDTINLLKRRAVVRSARWVKTIFEKEPAGFDDIQALTTAFQNAVNLKGFSDPELQQLLKRLSPLENGLQTAWLRDLFRSDKVLLRGSLDYGFKSNGLYQQLAALYAAAGNVPKALQCIDTLIKYGQANPYGDYALGSESAINIAAVFFTAGKPEQLSAFVDGYTARKHLTPADFYQRMIGRMLPSFFTSQVLDLYFWSNINQNRNLIFTTRKEQAFYFSKFREALSAISDADDRNFKLAMAYKNEGMLKAYNNEEPSPGDSSADQDFDQAVALYARVSPAYRAVPTRVAYSSGEDQLVLPRSALFVFPDYRTESSPFELRNYFYFGISDAFLDYIFRKNLFHSLYPGPAEVKEISSWLSSFYSKMFVPQAFMLQDLPYKTLRRLDSSIVQYGFADVADWNRLYLQLGYQAQEQHDSAAMLGYYRKMKLENVLTILRVKELDGQANDLVLRMIAYAAEGCMKAGQHDLGQSFINVFKNPVNRSSLYAMMANIRLIENFNDSLTAGFIDSARMETLRTEDIHAGEPNRRLLASALIMQNPKKNASEAFRLIKNIAEKTDGTRNICRAYGFREDLYDAVSIIPALTSDSDIPFYYWFVLHGYTEGKPVPSKDWETFSKNYIKPLLQNILYVDENN